MQPFGGEKKDFRCNITEKDYVTTSLLRGLSSLLCCILGKLDSSPDIQRFTNTCQLVNSWHLLPHPSFHSFPQHIFSELFLEIKIPFLVFAFSGIM